MKQKPAQRRPGRPASSTPRTGAGGKGRVLSANISQRARDLLEAEAEETGFSISQIADRWLQSAGEGAATYEQRLGGNPARITAHERLEEIARAIEGAIPDRYLAHFMIVAAWQKAVPAVLGAAPATPELMETLRKTGTAVEACQSVITTLNAAGEHDPVRRRLMRAVGKGGETLAGVLGTDAAIIMAAGSPTDLAIALQDLRSAGQTARTEIDRALALVSATAEHLADQRKKEIDADKIADRIVAKITGARP